MANGANAAPSSSIRRFMFGLSGADGSIDGRTH
jgi:hypothetical protein